MIILFVNEESKDLLAEYRKIAYANVEEREIVFCYHDSNAKGENYVAKYITHSLGLSKSDFPALRALKYNESGSLAKYKLSDEITNNSMMNFFDEFKRNNLQSYQKS